MSAPSAKQRGSTKGPPDADIFLISEDLQVPVSVKTHPSISFRSHKAFIRGQLIKQYARHTPSDAMRHHGVHVILSSSTCTVFERPRALQRAPREGL